MLHAVTLKWTETLNDKGGCGASATYDLEFLWAEVKQPQKAWAARTHASFLKLYEAVLVETFTLLHKSVLKLSEALGVKAWRSAST